MTRRNVLKVDDFFLNLFVDEVSVDLDMLGPVVVNWIFSYAEGGLIIAQKLDGTFDIDLEVVENSL